MGVSLHFLLCNTQMGSLGFPSRLILALKLHNRYHALALLPGTKLFTGTTSLNPHDSPNSSALVAPFYRSENGSKGSLRSCIRVTQLAKELTLQW